MIAGPRGQNQGSPSKKMCVIPGGSTQRGVDFHHAKLARLEGGVTTVGITIRTKKKLLL